MLFRKLLKIAVAFGVCAAVLFTLLPQQVNAQQVNKSADELFGACGQDQLCKDAHAAYDACVGNGNNSQTCKDAAAKEDASLNARELANTDPAAQFGYWIAQIVYVFTVGFAGVVLYMASIILNTAVSISLDSAVYGLQFVSDGWTMIRDLANMAFIFILVYIALKVMFEAHTAGTMEKLIKVILVALVINFSFFATRVVIDAGNLLSIQFYNVIVSTPEATLTFAHTPYGDLAVNAPDITAKIMSGINFTETFKPENFQTAFQGDGASNFVTSLILFSVLYIVLGAAMFMLAAAFITAAVKFVIRIVMLWMAIVTSPLALVSWSFQDGHGHGGGGHGHESGFSFSSWRSDLIKYAFYPALFLFILLLISQFMSSNGVSGLGTDELTAGNVQGGLAGIIPPLANIGVRLAFVLVMLHYALKAENFFKDFAFNDVAKSMGNLATFGGLSGYLRRTSVPASRAIGGTAALSNTLLKQSGLLNKNNIMGDAARGLSKNALQPLTKTSFAGEKSFLDKQHDAEHKAHESADRVLLEKARKSKDPKTDLTKAEQDKINKMSANMFAGIPSRDMEKISHIFSEEAHKKVQESDLFGHALKHDIEHAWHAGAKAAPQQQADEQIKELRNIASKLSGLLIGTDKLEDRIKLGTKVNKASIKEMRGAFDDRMSELNAEFEVAKATSDKVAMGAADKERTRIKQGLEALTKLGEQSGKVPGDYSVKV